VCYKPGNVSELSSGWVAKAMQWSDCCLEAASRCITAGRPEMCRLQPGSWVRVLGKWKFISTWQRQKTQQQ